MKEKVCRFHYCGQEELQLPASRDAFSSLKQWLTTIAFELDLSESKRKQLLIATDEIFTNIASYGYPAGEGTIKISVSFDIDSSELVIAFKDDGVAYNPLDAPLPDISSPLANRKVGGLGLFMVKKLMDSIEYERDNDSNVTILRKKLLDLKG